MNDEDTRSAPIVIQQAQDMLTGRKAANAFIDSYEEVSNITVPEEKKQQVHEERREFNQRKHQEDYMNKPFNMKEFEEAVKTLSQKKSPGPDKLMERLINTRLSWHLEKNNILTPEQAGFRQHRSTEDQVAYIAQKIEDGYQDKKHTLTVWIDMEKAFDKVWKDGLRLKLQKCGVTGCMLPSPRWWNIQPKEDAERRSSSRGVLSPTLFLVFINDIIKDLPRNVQGAIYADDLVLWCTEEHLTTANYRLQEALNVLQDWTKRCLSKSTPKRPPTLSLVCPLGNRRPL
ncbi:hypothetical protein C0Q70_05130 [Pomacea canaliculata]|uniref:Reverse transcriptase domain-containing protein n=1 Tax=Pomacea canaliculata TaxID=400727 RepID=A0A2T7PKD2_POMCA|nr:hypothetical protein C0Q70_05130 [Pomacea canaliculata]